MSRRDLPATVPRDDWMLAWLDAGLVDGWTVGRIGCATSLSKRLRKSSKRVPKGSKMEAKRSKRASKEAPGAQGATSMGPLVSKP